MGVLMKAIDSSLLMEIQPGIEESLGLGNRLLEAIRPLARRIRNDKKLENARNKIIIAGFENYFSLACYRAACKTLTNAGSNREEEFGKFCISFFLEGFDLEIDSETIPCAIDINREGIFVSFTV